MHNESPSPPEIWDKDIEEVILKFHRLSAYAGNEISAEYTVADFFIEQGFNPEDIQNYLRKQNSRLNNIPSAKSASFADTIKAILVPHHPTLRLKDLFRNFSSLKFGKALGFILPKKAREQYYENSLDEIQEDRLVARALRYSSFSRVFIELLFLAKIIITWLYTIACCCAEGINKLKLLFFLFAGKEAVEFLTRFLR